MKQTEIIMGMPITIEVVEPTNHDHIAELFDWFRSVDERFSTYKKNSEISRINRGLPKRKWSDEMKTILALCDETKRQTDGYFDIEHHGKLDPSGLVKGWSIWQAAGILAAYGYDDFYIEAGGDVEARGHNAKSQPWQVGIRNPFSIHEIIKVLAITDRGVATSGTYIRGEHVYDPHADKQAVSTIKSLTVVGPNVYEADRFATAAFAMGEAGITFIERLDGFEAYMVDENKMATFTSGFEAYVAATD